ncbi:MAG: YfhO family protein [Ferruginibacter sp.]
MAKKNIKEAPKQPRVVSPAIDFFETLGNKCQWIVLVLLVIMAVIVFRDFLFFDKIFLYKDIGSDSINGYYPFLVHNIHYFEKYGFPSWSFEAGMGQNVFTSALADPVDLLFYPLGVETARSLLGYKIAIEVVLSGFVFYHYLRSINMGQFVSVVGSLMFAFSGFMMVSSCWFVFAPEVLTMPFILLGFEKLYKKNQFWLLPLPIFYITLTRPFVLISLSIFLFFYISFRLLQNDEFKIKSYLLVLGKTALVALIGVLIAAPWLLEHVQVMLDSPRGSGANSVADALKAAPMFAFADKLQLGTAVCRTFASDILGSGIDFKGYQNIFEAPLFYCGIPALLLLPQLFFASSKKQKIVFGSFLGIWILAIIFPYFRYAFNIFTGNYYRSFSFYVGLVFTILSLMALDKIIIARKINIPGLFVTALVLLILLFYPYFEEDVKVAVIRNFVVIAILAYTFLLSVVPKINKAVQFSFLGFLVIELVYLSSISINNRDILTTDEANSKAGYNDYSVEAINFIKKQDSGFVRIDKRYSSSPAMHLSLNDGMSQSFNGTSSYNSFNQKYYIQYLKAMGIITGTEEAATRWAEGLKSRIIPEGLNAVKYVLTKFPLDPQTLALFDSVARFGDVTVLKHKFALPLGFAYQAVFSLTDFEKCSPTQKDFMSMRAAIVPDKNMNEMKSLKRLSINDSLPVQFLSLEKIKTLTDELLPSSFQIKNFKPRFINGSINMSAPGIVYFSIPYDDGWNISDDKNRQYNKILLSNGMIGIYLDAGNYNLNLSFNSKNLAVGKKITVAGLVLFLFLVFLSVKFKNRKTGVLKV